MQLHDELVQKILTLPIQEIEIDVDDFIELFDDHENYGTCKLDTLNVYRCSDGYTRILDENLQVEDIIKLFNINGKRTDAYGSIITKKTLLLNNYDAPFVDTDDIINIIGFATIDINGLVRFSQIVYNIKYKKLLIRDTFSHTLPFKPNLERDFGGKRGIYRHGNILSIRTIEDVYAKTDIKYHQSDKYKNCLSYPRLELTQS